MERFFYIVESKQLKLFTLILSKLDFVLSKAKFTPPHTQLSDCQTIAILLCRNLQILFIFCRVFSKVYRAISLLFTCTGQKNGSILFPFREMICFFYALLPKIFAKVAIV